MISLIFKLIKLTIKLAILIGLITGGMYWYENKSAPWDNVDDYLNYSEGKLKAGYKFVKPGIKSAVEEGKEMWAKAKPGIDKKIDQIFSKKKASASSPAVDNPEAGEEDVKDTVYFKEYQAGWKAMEDGKAHFQKATGNNQNRNKDIKKALFNFKNALDHFDKAKAANPNDTELNSITRDIRMLIVDCEKQLSL